MVPAKAKPEDQYAWYASEGQSFACRTYAWLKPQEGYTVRLAKAKGKTVPEGALPLGVQVRLKRFEFSYLGT